MRFVWIVIGWVLVVYSATAQTRQTLRAIVLKDVPLVASLDTSIQTPQVGFWRTARNAGANALYIALRGAGRDIRYEDVVNAVAVSERGVNLEAIADGAGALGYPMQAAMASPSKLQVMELPVILHLDPVARSVAGGGRAAVLVSLDVDRGSASLIDGVSTVATDVDLEELYQIWSGAVIYAAAPKTKRSAWGAWCIVLGLGFTGFGLGGWSAHFGRSRS